MELIPGQVYKKIKDDTHWSYTPFRARHLTDRVVIVDVNREVVTWLALGVNKEDNEDKQDSISRNRRMGKLPYNDVLGLMQLEYELDTAATLRNMRVAIK